MWGNSIIALCFTCGERKIWWNIIKYYKNDCLQNFILLLMSLLTVPFVKNSHIWAGIYYIFLKNILKHTWKSFNTKFWPQWKGSKKQSASKKILALFCHLVARSFGRNCKWNQVWRGLSGKLEAKHWFQTQSFTKYFRQILVFMWNSEIRENLNFCYWAVFCKYQQIYYFGGKAGH